MIGGHGSRSCATGFQQRFDRVFNLCTLEHNGQVVVASSWVSELHMLVSPPSNSRLYQMNSYFASVWMDVKQLQSIYKNETNYRNF